MNAKNVTEEVYELKTGSTSFLSETQNVQIRSFYDPIFDDKLDSGYSPSNLSANFIDSYDNITWRSINYTQSAYNINEKLNRLKNLPWLLDLFLKMREDTYSDLEYIKNSFRRIFPQTGGFLMADEGVLTSYIEAAIKQVKMEILEDGSCFCEIPSCPGVWANENTIQECLIELRQAIELWLILKLKDKDPLPILGGIDLNKIGSEFIEDNE